MVESLPRGDLELRIDLRVALSFGGRRWTREASLMIRRAAAHPWEGVLESAPEWDCRALSGLPSECEVRLSPLPGVDLSGLGVVGEGCGVSVLEVSADGVRFDVEGRAPGSECRLMLMLGDRSIDSRVVRAEPPVELSLDLPGEVPVGGTANATLTVVNRAGVDVAGLVVSASASGAGGCSVSPDSAPVNVSAGGSVEVPFSVRVSREGPCWLRFSAALGGVEVAEERGSIAGVGWVSLSLSAPGESVGDFNVTVLLMNTHSFPVNLTVELSSSGPCEVSYRTLAVPVPPGGRSEVEVPVRVTGSGECSVSARISGGRRASSGLEPTRSSSRSGGGSGPVPGLHRDGRGRGVGGHPPRRQEDGRGRGSRPARLGGRPGPADGSWSVRAVGVDAELNGASIAGVGAVRLSDGDIIRAWGAELRVRIE